MIIDTSALLAVVLREPDAADFLRAILAARHPYMSVANWLEATIVVGGRGDPTAVARLDEFVVDAQIEFVAVSLQQGQLARDAWQRFGRGKHKAKLNFGDCFAYSLAREMREPLLFKGDDFAQTDIAPALKG